MRIVTKTPVRISFPRVFKAELPPSANAESKPRYSLTILIPKTDIAFHAQIMNAFAEEAKVKWGVKADQIIKACLADKISTCIRDGDVSLLDSMAGHWYLQMYRPETAGRPEIVNRNKTPIMANDGLIYAGCWCNVIFETWLQDNQNGKGLRASLLGVQFVRHDTPFGGPSKATAEEFDVFEDDEEFDPLA